MKASLIFSAMVLAASLNVNAANNEEKPLKGLKENNNVSLFAALEDEEEQMTAINSWMLDVESFIETDEFREVEDWMLEPATFAKPGTTEEAIVLDEYFSEEYEEETLEIESWMLSTESFDVNYFETDYDEKFLPIEDWMFNF
jgi:hypothetical protein